MTMANILAFASPAEAPKPETMSDALKLLTALSDVKGTSAALRKLQDATEAARSSVAEADEKSVAVDRREQQLQKRLAAEADDMQRARNEHQKRMDDERRDHDQRLAQRERDLVLREAAVKAADAKYLELNSTLERKLALIRKVSDAT